MRFWEVRRVVRGYRKRDIPKLQMMRICAYWACYSMRDPKGEDPAKFLPMAFDDEEEEEYEYDEDGNLDLLKDIEAVNTLNEGTDG